MKKLSNAAQGYGLPPWGCITIDPPSTDLFWSVKYFFPFKKKTLGEKSAFKIYSLEQKGQKGLHFWSVFITKLRKFTLDLNKYEYGFLFNYYREQRHDSLSLLQYIRIYTSSAAILIRKKINFRNTHPQMAPLKASDTLL